VREIAPYATAVLLGFGAFFCALTVFVAHPFATSAHPPAEGTGLNPLLRHTIMMFHPPALYSGYTLLAIPFAFAIGALITGRLGAEWIQVTRRFALAAWLLLGIGLLLGARWSYTELGWGGYWAWDPVENAALMPWLCCTAFIHSIMIQEKRGMLKLWNVSLILATGALSILGTFLVRSGILDSIHSFVSSAALNVPFVTLIGVIVIASAGLVLWRRRELRSDHQLDSLLSREAVFLLQNLVLVAMTLVIFWITFFPLISEAITGTKVSVGPPAFTPFVVPLALVLVLLSGIGPLIAWRRVTVANLRRSFAFPIAAGAITLVALLLVGGVDRRPFALIMFCLGAFVVAAVAQELWRGTAARRAMTRDSLPVAFVQLIRRNRRRYGGYIVHAGLAVLLVGVAASSSFAHARDVVLKPGQSASVDGYKITFVRPTASATAEKISLGAVLDVSKGSRHVSTLTTWRGFYPSQDASLGVIGRFFGGDAESQVGLRTGATKDIWTVINPDLGPIQGLINEGNAKFLRAMQAASTLPPTQARAQLPTLFALRDQAIAGLAKRFVTHPWGTNFRLIVSPLVTWLWVGSIIVALGGLIALWPLPRVARSRRLATAGYPARAPSVPARETV
jgi:cytochrome c-type biogenesis protein CcmF